MNLVALVMAGGKGERMEINKEKPLIYLKDKPMIKYVLDALQEVERIEKIYVATSPKTPKTHNFIKNSPFKAIRTSGKGYHSDLEEAIEKIGKKPTLSITSDLPLVDKETLNKVIDKYEESEKPALSVFVEPNKPNINHVTEETYSIDGKEARPSGVNIISGEKIQENFIEQENIKLEETKLALNVNNTKRLAVAEKILSEKQK